MLADSSKFPEDWLFKHRWGKGKKDSLTTLPNGAKITYLTVGGRTSCVIPSVQKKTGAVAGDVNGSEGRMEDSAAKKDAKSNGTKKRKVTPKLEESDDEDQEVETVKKHKAVKGSKTFASKVPMKPAKESKTPAKKPSIKSAQVKEEESVVLGSGRRRSGRGNPKA